MDDALLGESTVDEDRDSGFYLNSKPHRVPIYGELEHSFVYFE